MTAMNMNNSSSNGLMLAAEMAMVFYNGHSTPLYSISWMPKTVGGYAGTCIFLVVLAIVFRLLMVAKLLVEARWYKQAVARRYVAVVGRQPLAEAVMEDTDSKSVVLSTNGVEEHVRIVAASSRLMVQPWRFSIDLPRAALVTCQVGVGYLLMLAAMTMNIGYFASILAGTLIGEIAVGRYTQSDIHGH